MVLEGARELIARARPIVIIEHVRGAAELYGVRSDAVWELLSSFDYRIFAITGDGPVGRAELGADADVVNWLASPARAS